MHTLPQQDRRKTRRWWPVVISIITFAVLMAVRSELPSMWARAAAASGAFMILCLGVCISSSSRG